MFKNSVDLPSSYEQFLMIEGQWRKLQRMGAELDRVTVVDWQPPSA